MDPKIDSGAASPRRPLPRWKKSLLVLSALLFASGAGLKGYTYFRGGKGGGEPKVFTDPSKRGAGEDALALERSLTGEPRAAMRRIPGEVEGPAAGDEEEVGPAETLSPALMKGGLSFFVGFCMGFAVRTFFRVSAFVIGAGLLVVFGLVWAGVIPQIDWMGFEEHFNRIVSSLWEQASGFRRFVEGNLPSAGAAAAGLFTGFKRH